MPEYGCAVHFDVTYSQPLFGGRAEARIAGSQVVVWAGGVRFLGHAGGCGLRRLQGQDWRVREGGGGWISGVGRRDRDKLTEIMQKR